MDQQKFPIVIYRKPTILEILSIIIIILFTFILFIYGIKTKQPIFCLSIIFGIICFKAFDTINKEKFTIPKIIQKHATISFSDNGIEINENQNNIIYKWSDLEEIEINIFAYKGRRYNYKNDHLGTENSIIFIKNEQKFKYQFFIQNVNQFKLTKEQFHKTILPKLNQFQNLKEEDYLQAQINFARNYNRLNNDTDYF